MSRTSSPASASSAARSSGRPTLNGETRCTPTGTDVDSDDTDLVKLDLSLAADKVDRRHERLRVAPALYRFEQGDYAFVPADRAADLQRRRFDTEDQHRHAARASSTERNRVDQP